MVRAAIFLVLLASCCCCAVSALSVVQIDDVPISSGRTRRKLMTPVVVGSDETTRTSFRPLACNVNLDNVSCDTTWSQVFSNTSLHSDEIVIPCGECITMDHRSSSSLTLEGGLDIQGKLVFPDGYKLVLQAPYIRIQGELHIYSNKAPNGQEDVRFVLTGIDENITQFRPADSNTDACGGADGEMCTVGKKPIVIAGGKLVIEALPHDFPSWVTLYDVVDATNTDEDRSSALVLTDKIRGLWGIGADVLITSHTQKYDDEQVRTITNITSHTTEPGYVVVELDSSIWRPTTMKDNPNFAVEVALLARNIVFEGAKDDPNELHGAHLIVYHTPLVKQKLEGVEFRNFGQQANLGRYPIHFHLSGYVTGSQVSKNLIRESNQRCIVVHGTHYLTVQDNVAYDTAGHCFMLEDGQEHGNWFRKNLGALTRRVDTIIPDNGSNGEETDDRPSTFWITRVVNSWEGNVAAGSEDNGFWIELRSSVRGPEADMYPDLNPRRESLTLFRNNVAHSNRNKGIRTYPHGLDAAEGASFVGCRSYRNEEDGIFFHNSRNLTVEGGIYADNREQLDFDRAEFIALRDATVIGVSPEFREVMKTQDVDANCKYGKVVGVQLHTFTRGSGESGAHIQNVSFSGFVDTGCDQAFAIDFNDETRRGTFDYFSVLEDVVIEDGAIPVNLCEAKEHNVTDVYLTDLSSSLHASTSRSFSGSSTIISDDSWFSSFLPSERCLMFANQCLAYCEDTCLRTVTYQTDPTGSESYKLKVCNDEGRCVEVDNSFWFEEEDTEIETLKSNTRYDRLRYFSVTLPKGSYVAKFVDDAGNSVWPTFVEATYEEAFCPDALTDGSVELVLPSVTGPECRSLLRNGNAEASAVDHNFWLHRRGGVSLLSGMGIDGSNAFRQLNSSEADRDAIAQYLDTRCLDLMAGRQYEVIAFVKLVNETTGQGYTCVPGVETDCPEVGVYVHSQDGSWSREDLATVVVASSPNTSGYQRIHGILDVTDEVSSSTSVLFYIRRHVENVTMLVDNLSMTLVPIHDNGDCDNLVFNGNFNSGDSRAWSDRDDHGLAIVSPGHSGSLDYALSSFGGGMEQYIRTGCMKVGTSYVARASFKLVGDDGQEFACRSRRASRSTRCPVMQFRIQVNGEKDTDTVARITGTPSNTEWNALLGGFVANEGLASAESIRLQFRDVPDGFSLVIDDVIVTEHSSAKRLIVPIFTTTATIWSLFVLFVS